MSDSDRDRPADATATATVTTVATAVEPGPRSPAADELVTKRRERYRIGAEIARGGLGRILEAHDFELGRRVAIKELLHRDALSEARFVREATVTARLEHPAIIPVHDAGRWPDGEPFYAMKLVDGRRLKDVVTEADSLAERMALLPHILAVADALAYAHAEGIVHRDLKPSNLLVGAYGETVVIDWGLAKDLRDGDDEPGAGNAPIAGPMVTAAGAVLGTPAYMSPEQARGESVDRRADVYALGAVLYFTLTGRPLYSGDDSREVLERVRSEAPTPVETQGTGLPPDLAAIVARAIERDADARYQDAGELADDLRRFTTGQLVGAHDYSAMALIGRFVRRHRGIVALAVASSIIVAIAITASIIRVRREARQTRATLASVLVEQGRRELVDRRPLRAMAYFAGALELEVAVDPPLATMLDQAVGPARSVEMALVGHRGPVTAVAVSPDGSTLWTGSADGTVRVWNLPAGTRRAEVAIGAPVLSLVVSPDGARLAIATTAAVELRDATLEPIATLASKVRDGRRPQLGFSRDGKRLLLAGLGSFAEVHDGRTGDRLARFAINHTELVSSAQWSTDETAIITASHDATARIWDAASYRERAALEHETVWGPNPVVAARISPDGKSAITAVGLGVVVVWDVATATEIHRIQVPGVRDAIYSDDGAQIIALADQVSIWSASSGAAIARLPHPDAVAALMVRDPTGKRLAVLGSEGSQLVWSTDDWSLLGSLRWRAVRFNAAAFTPDGQRLISGDDGWEVSVWRPSIGALERTFAVPRLAAVVLHRATGRLITAGGDGAVVWDVAGGASISRTKSKTLGAVFDVPGERAVVLTADQRYQVAEINTGVVSATLEQVGEPMEKLRWKRQRGIGDLPVAFSPDGAAIAGVQIGGGAQVWDSRTGRRLITLSAGGMYDSDVVFSPRGDRLFASHKSTVGAWKVGAWEPLWSIDTGGGAAVVLAVSADGSLIVAGDALGSAWLYNADGSLRAGLESIHRGAINEATFVISGGELLLILASDDRTASITEVATGRLRGRLEGHEDMIAALDVSPDGSLVATGSPDGSVRLWDIGSGRPLVTLAGTSVLESTAAWFTNDGRRLVTSIGRAAALWRLRDVPPTLDEIRGLSLPWKLERGNLVRDQRLEQR